MAEILRMPAVPRSKGRRRICARTDTPLARAVSLQKYRDNVVINSGLAGVKQMQRDSYVHLTVTAFGDLTYDCHFNHINIEPLMDALVFLMSKARVVRAKGSASYQSE